MRSKWKGIFIPYLVYKFICSKEIVFSLKWIYRHTPLRSSVFIKSLFGRSLLIHNGHTYMQKRISLKYIGLKIGQLFLTKFTPIHYSETKFKKRMRQERFMRRKHKKK